MKVSIITLVHNTKEHLKSLFDYLQNNTSGLGFDKEWIIVDNGSTDLALKQYYKEIRKYPGIRIVANEENETFSKANNSAANRAKGEWLVFLNSDTIPQKGWLDNMLDCAERNNADIVGARMYFPNSETIQHAGVVQTDNGIFTHRYYQQKAADHPDIMEECEMMVTAACMLIKKKTFEELGKFDEGFVWGYEDVDLNLKAIANDKKVMYCPSAFLYHHEHGTDQKINKHFNDNLKLLDKKWGILK